MKCSSSPYPDSQPAEGIKSNKWVVPPFSRMIWTEVPCTVCWVRLILPGLLTLRQNTAEEDSRRRHFQCRILQELRCGYLVYQGPLHSLQGSLAPIRFWRCNVLVKTNVKEGFPYLGLVYVPCHYVPCTVHQQTNVFPNHVFAADIPIEALLAFLSLCQMQLKMGLSFLNPIPALILCLYIPSGTHDCAPSSCKPPLFCLILVRISLLIHATPTFLWQYETALSLEEVMLKNHPAVLDPSFH